MGPTKKGVGTAAALAALGVGTAEQATRMAGKPTPKAEKKKPAAQPRVQISVQFSAEGMALLRQAQARLLERGVPRAAVKGVALEHVLREWLGGLGK
jgi:hypothetical protein